MPAAELRAVVGKSCCKLNTLPRRVRLYFGLGWTRVQPFSFIPSDLSHAPSKAHGPARGAVGGDAVALTVPVAPHRQPCPVLDAS
jgi:hypothetical protein